MPVIEQKTTNKNKVDFDLNRLDKSKTTIFSKYPIKLSRIAQGYTQEVLAERAEVSVEHLKQVERGKKMLSVESLVNVAKALQVSVDSLIYEQTINSAKNDIAQMLVSIDNDDSQRLLDLIRYVNDRFLKKR